eukprot:gnl/MRDRNA2_/MRDRNA2_368798_c0_seq1.p1 gnl/MRDRNA2_/MRDRNA2_368798_c0~~gnl/MRDRNA2_/MRDRNA2_368798_c0_seq1.p1  ORF type:complete len:110 (+),score=12.12 gnl/MRDRNA2_/MRDRNA2_368798_c0_seq1:63-392(+)
MGEILFFDPERGRYVCKLPRLGEEEDKFPQVFIKRENFILREEPLLHNICACHGSSSSAHVKCLVQLSRSKWPNLDYWQRYITCKAGICRKCLLRDGVVVESSCKKFST